MAPCTAGGSWRRGGAKGTRPDHKLYRGPAAFRGSRRGPRGPHISVLAHAGVLCAHERSLVRAHVRPLSRATAYLPLGLPAHAVVRATGIRHPRPPTSHRQAVQARSKERYSCTSSKV
eukprot:4140812-Prymnesium_polylepis.1